MQLKEIYNYKAADTGLDTRITALENAMGTDSEGTVDARIQAAIDAAKAPLESADTALDGRVTTLEGQVNTLNGDAQTQGSVKQQVATAVAGIVASAPEAYDTLKEIADWISGDVSGAAAMNTRITDNAGAISVGEKGRLEIGNEEPVLFQGNIAGNYGGALEVETMRDNYGNNIHNTVFKENNAQWGGAVAVYGKSGKSTNMYLKDCTVEGNYASKDGGAFYVEDESLIDLTRISLKANHADDKGGAVCIHGWKGVQAFRSSFIGNYAGTGGAIYTEGSGEKYSYFYIDECSFDANYISNRYGCTINVNGLDKFCMNNSSVRGSYTTSSKSSYKKGLNASWIAIDVIQTCSSISNCSVIGDTRSGAEGGALTDNTALVGVMGTATHYFTNNIIAPESEGVASIGGEADTEVIDLSYTHYNKLVKIGTSTDKGGNASSVLATAIGGLGWSNDTGCWPWNGQLGGSAPSMIAQAAIIERLNGICPEFVTWCGEDINMDQHNVARGESWWPGAYQN